MIVAAAEGSTTFAPQATTFFQVATAEAALALREELSRQQHRAIIIDDPQIPENTFAAVVRALQLVGYSVITIQQVSDATREKPSQVLDRKGL